MAADLNVLFLRLEGPLQSWGDEARWSVRRTRPEPSKSGVVGLLAAAMGLGWDSEGDAEIARLGRELRLGIRVERPGTPLRDYHTVEGGVLSAEGKIKINAATRKPETVVSERYYLADACFLAALSGPEELLEQARAALERPVWPLFLGRKSCPFSAPSCPALPAHPTTGRFRNLRAALESMPPLETAPPGRRRTNSGPRRVVIELAPGEPLPERALTFYRTDVPLSFVRRQFTTRTVYEDLLLPLAEVQEGER